MTLIISKERQHRGFKVETMRQSDHFYCLILLSFHHLLCFPLSKFTPPSSTSALKVPLQVSVVGFLHCLDLTTRGNLSGSQTKLNLQNTQHPHFFFFSLLQQPPGARRSTMLAPKCQQPLRALVWRM